MEIKELKVTIGEVCEGYLNDAEEGVIGYDDGKKRKRYFHTPDRAGHTSRERHAVFCMWEQPYKNLRTLRRRREAPR